MNIDESEPVNQNPVLAPKQETPPELLTKRELAVRLRKSPRCIEIWMRKRYLPYIKIGHSVFFRWSDVCKRLDQFRVN